VTTTICRWLAALSLVLTCGVMQGCTEDEDPDPAPSPSPSTGSPFSATLEGPDVAAPGDQVTATLTNTGRLPDRYRFVSNPEGGATMTPVELSLAPGETAEVTIDVAAPPVIVRAESLGGGGSGIALAQLSIGLQE
jgi:hypothetical protein